MLPVGRAKNRPASPDYPTDPRRWRRAGSQSAVQCAILPMPSAVGSQVLNGAPRGQPPAFDIVGGTDRHHRQCRAFAYCHPTPPSFPHLMLPPRRLAPELSDAQPIRTVRCVPRARNIPAYSLPRPAQSAEVRVARPRSSLKARGYPFLVGRSHHWLRHFQISTPRARAVAGPPDQPLLAPLPRVGPPRPPRTARKMAR